jgi:hypothetical protein
LVEADRPATKVPNVANQIGLILLLLSEVIVVVALTRHSTEKRIALSGGFAIAAFICVLIGSIWGAKEEDLRVDGAGRQRSLSDRSLTDKMTLVATRNGHAARAAGSTGPRAFVACWLPRLGQVAVILLALSAAFLLTDLWTAIPIAVAFGLATVTLMIGRLHPARFFWYGCAIFASVCIFGATLYIDRTFRTPSLQPAAVLLKDGHTVTGYYVADKSNRLYLGSVLLHKGKTGQAENEPVKGSGHLFWVNTADIQGYTIGPLQKLSNLDTWARRALDELKNTR